MSFAETRQIMADMQEIMALLGAAEIKAKTLTASEPRMQRTLQTFQRLESIALRYLTIARKIGIGEDIEKGIQKISQFIVVIQMAISSLKLLAATTATTPAGVALSIAGGAAGLVLAGLSAGNMMEGY